MPKCLTVLPTATYSFSTNIAFEPGSMRTESNKGVAPPKALRRAFPAPGQLYEWRSPSLNVTASSSFS